MGRPGWDVRCKQGWAITSMWLSGIPHHASPLDLTLPLLNRWQAICTPSGCKASGEPRKEGGWDRNVQQQGMPLASALGASMLCIYAHEPHQPPAETIMSMAASITVNSPAVHAQTCAGMMPGSYLIVPSDAPDGQLEEGHVFGHIALVAPK